MNESVAVPGWAIALISAVGTIVVAILAWALKEIYARARADIEAKKIVAGEAPDRRTHETCAVHDYLDRGLEEVKNEFGEMRREVKSGLEKLFDLHREHNERHAREMLQGGRKEIQ